MARKIAVLALIIAAGLIAANSDTVFVEGLRDKLWLVALFPAVYILGIVVLSD